MMKIQNVFFILLLALVVCCDNQSNDVSTNFTSSKLVGSWQLSETYISPGGVTEWVDVENGFIYIFDSDATFKKTVSDGALQESGRYRTEERELFLEFEFEGEQTTIGYCLELTDGKITLSPSFPAICIEGCYYRFKRK